MEIRKSETVKDWMEAPVRHETAGTFRRSTRQRKPPGLRASRGKRSKRGLSRGESSRPRCCGRPGCDCGRARTWLSWKRWSAKDSSRKPGRRPRQV